MPAPTGRKPAAAVRSRRAAFCLGSTQIEPGQRSTIDLPVSLLSNHTPMSVPVHVVHGRREGPRLFVSAAVHGDELNGVEIIRRLLGMRRLQRLRGTLLAVPVVNVYGFIGNTRYLPDRRDLNRSFPGSSGGSMAAQLAHLFTTQVIANCTHGIDLHTGAVHRNNFPQIRVDLAHEPSAMMARSFGAPLVLNTAVREGSLRMAAMRADVPTLVYEAGEALRFDEFAIRVGVRGIARVMETLGMLTRRSESRDAAEPVTASSSYWVRAPMAGILRSPAPNGRRIGNAARMGVIADPFGESEKEVCAGDGGIVIGRNNLPVVNQGDALFHVARVVDARSAAQAVERFREAFENGSATEEAPEDMDG